MPLRRFKRKRTRKRTFKSRPYKRIKYARKRYRTRIPRAPSGLPVNRPVRMRYCKEGFLSSTSGVLNSEVFAMNDIWDPEVAAGGHQPMGFDQMAALYNRYIVLGAKVRVTFYDNASTHSVPAVVGACTSDGTVAPYIESKYFIEAKRGSFRHITGGARRPITVTCKYSPKRFFGIKDTKDHHSTIGALVTGSPNNRAFCIVWCQATDGGTQSLSMTVVIDFLVQFTEPKDLDGS